MSDQAEAASGALWADATAEQTFRRYRTLAQAIEDGVLHLDDGGHVIAVNDGFLGITGHAREDLLGEHASLVIDAECCRRIERTITGSHESTEQHTATFEPTVDTATGESVPCELQMHLQVGDESREAVCIVRERTEGAAHENGKESDGQEFRGRERRLPELMANVPGMVYRCRNARGWPMEFVSDAAEELTGYRPQALMEGEVSWGEDIIVQEDREMVWETVQREIAEDGTFTVTYQIDTADGERRWARDYGRGIFDDEGSLVEIEGIISDITEDKRTEQRLAEERDMFADGPAVVFRWKPDEAAGWPVEYVSENVEEVLGYTPTELESGDVPYADLLLAEEIDRIAREVEENSDGETERFSHDPYRIRTKDGGIRWVKDTTKIVRDEDGTITNYLGYLVDITERKERERELQRYETIVETVNDGVYVVDEEGRFTMVNEAYVEMVGYDREELLGEHVSRVADEETIELAQRTEAEMRRENTDGPTVEAVLRTADGERIPSEATFALLPGEDGRTERVGVARDISERKERERRLEESERRYRTLVENFPNGSVGLFDEDLRYTAVGGQLFDELEFDPEDRTGKRITEIHDDELIAEIEPYFTAALDGERKTFDIEVFGRSLHATTLPIENPEGEVFAGMIVVQDVTERREYERKLKESNERLEQFAYAASHDLQEPLRMVSSYLQLIEDRYGDEFDEEAQEFLEFAVDGAERMRNMIDGLLEYSRVETEGKPFQPVDLEEVLDDVLQDLRVKIQEHDADITVASLGQVEGDRNQLRQVCQNLLDNAIEYSGDEPPRVHVSAERTGDQVTVSVRDDGIGIDSGHQERVFEVFQRLHSHDEHAGTGIGLSLCRRIVERHGGEIWIDSEPGEGTTVSFTLPATDAA
ncbi:MAG: PAS domain S-box protein [Halolamina sp.]